MAKEPRDLSRSWIVIIGLPIFLVVLGAFLSPFGQQATDMLFRQTGPAGNSSSTEGTLHIDAMTYNNMTGTLDVLLRNTDSTDAVISTLTIKALEEKVLHGSGYLPPSQGFQFPIVDLPVGEERSINVNHFVTAKQADHIVIFLDTIRRLKIRLTITYNGGKTVSEEIWLMSSGIP